RPLDVLDQARVEGLRGLFRLPPEFVLVDQALRQLDAQVGHARTKGTLELAQDVVTPRPAGALERTLHLALGPIGRGSIEYNFDQPPYPTHTSHQSPPRCSAHVVVPLLPARRIRLSDRSALRGRDCLTRERAPQRG